MAARETVRGQPLVAILAIILAWIVLRIVTLAFGNDRVEPPVLPAGLKGILEPSRSMPPPQIGQAFRKSSNSLEGTAHVARWSKQEHGAVSDISFEDEPNEPLPSRLPPSISAAIPPLASAIQEGWEPLATRHKDQTSISLSDRLSGDAWFALRGRSAPGATEGISPPSYGGSQAGVVLRYALDPASKWQPTLFSRMVTTLRSARESDVAAGLSVRPISAAPIALHAEARISDRASGTTIRPAAFLAGGINALPIANTGGLARGYVQAGYVGGADATFFADGSLVIERPLLGEERFEVLAGTGAWGGAQRGAERLDLGPSVAMRFPIGDRTALIEAQYRFRLAGNAEPSNQPAITLSVGF